MAAYPLWLHLTPENFDSHDPLTANLQALNLASVGALTPLKGATTKFTSLIQSSDQAMPIDADEARAKLPPQQLMASIRPTGRKHYTIAARISGPVKTAFPNGPPPLAAGAAPLPAQAKETKADANIVVVADTDILDDRFWVRVQDLYGKQLASTFADNGAFVLNAVENLMGSDDLISLRTRATNDRPFTVVQKLQADAQAQFLLSLRPMRSSRRWSTHRIVCVPCSRARAATMRKPRLCRPPSNPRSIGSSASCSTRARSCAMCSTICARK